MHQFFTLGFLFAEAPDFATVINNIVDGIEPVFLPIAGLSLVIFLLLSVASPIFGDAVSQNKGYFMKVCLIVTTIGLIPSLLQFLYGLGGGAGSEEEGHILGGISLALVFVRPLVPIPAFNDVRDVPRSATPPPTA